MKFFYVSLSLVAAVTAISLTGCGKSNDSANNNGIVSAPAVPVGAPAGVGTIPVGCYYNNITGYNGTNGYNGYNTGYNTGYPTNGYNGYPTNGCVGGSPCPSGYIESANTCVLSNNGATSCPNGTWTGYACQPSGFQCPTGTTFSYQYGGCLWVGSGYPQQYPNYQTSPYQNGYIYYYTGQYGYQQGYRFYYYFNGYTWVRRYY